MIGWPLCAIALACLSLSSDAHGESTPSREDIALIRAFGEHLFAEGEFYRAVGEVERDVDLCSLCEDADTVRFRIAQAYQAGGDYESASRHFANLSDGTAHGPIARNSRWELASTLEAAKKYGEAAFCFDGYVGAFPDDNRAALAGRGAVRNWLRAELLDPARKTLRSHRAAFSSEEFTRLEGRLLAFDNLPRRSSATAGVLSAILPGAGQAYAGDWRQGLNVFVMNALWISAAAIAYQHEQYALSGVLGAGEVFWYGGGIVGARRVADRHNRTQRRLYFQETLSTL